MILIIGVIIYIAIFVTVLAFFNGTTKSVLEQKQEDEEQMKYLRERFERKIKWWKKKKYTNKQ